MSRWSLFCVLFAFVTAAPAVVMVEDDEGQTLNLATPAQRIVALAPHVAELLFSAGAGDKLVGTVAHSDYPSAALAVPRIGDHARLDLERIIALKPDAVVAWGGGNPQTLIVRLRELGLPVFVIEPHHLDDVARHLELLGQLAGTQSSARAAAADYRRELAALRVRYAGRSVVTVFYQVWHAPLMTVGGQQIITEAISLCGGRNIFAGLPGLSPTVSVEAVLAADPALIVTSSDQASAEVLSMWRRWTNLLAVRTDQLVALHPGDLSRATPRLLEGTQRMCKAIEDARTVPRRKPQ